MNLGNLLAQPLAIFGGAKTAIYIVEQFAQQHRWLAFAIVLETASTITEIEIAPRTEQGFKHQVAVFIAFMWVARGRGLRWFTKHAFACGDAERLPLADRSIDLIVSSLMLPSCPSPDAVLAEFQRVLVPGGLLMFSTLGPDTLCELRESWLAVDHDVHVHAFIDMHDLGDAMLRAGLHDVVMDTERMTARYADLATLTRELKQLGVSNAASGCSKSLTTSTSLVALEAAYEVFRRDTTLPASFEVVFGHAWRQPLHSVEVSAESLGRPTGRN